VRAWWREHRLKVGGFVLAATITWYGWVLFDVVHANSRQDLVDRNRTEQVKGINDQLADTVTKLEEERRVSCAYGNELRDNIRQFITALATNPAVIDQAEVDFADRVCPTIPTPTTEAP
jgi:glucose-6-phosphate-specific signal transduction histidine kinase